MKTWIFIQDPRKFFLNKYLQSRKVIFWELSNQLVAKHIQPNDRVYIWRADGDLSNSGGIIARGHVISSPRLMDDDAYLLWREPPPDEPALRIRIKLESVRISYELGMLTKPELLKEVAMEDFLISTSKKSAIQCLSKLQTALINRLWKQKEFLLAK